MIKNLIIIIGDKFSESFKFLGRKYSCNNCKYEKEFKRMNILLKTL